MKSTANGPCWLRMLEEKSPEWFQKLEIRVLMCLTAAACGKKGASLKGKSGPESLETYRDYTAKVAAEAGREELRQFRSAMYRRAYRLGRLISLLPGLKSEEKKRRLIVFLYKNIEIALGNAENEDREGGAGWEICIFRCSFSSVYTPRTCYVMSGLDAGIICGILGGGRLAFSRRITEGCSRCLASYESGKEN